MFDRAPPGGGRLGGDGPEARWMESPGGIFRRSMPGCSATIVTSGSTLEMEMLFDSLAARLASVDFDDDDSDATLAIRRPDAEPGPEWRRFPG